MVLYLQRFVLRLTDGFIGEIDLLSRSMQQISLAERFHEFMDNSVLGQVSGSLQDVWENFAFRYNNNLIKT